MLPIWRRGRGGVWVESEHGNKVKFRGREELAIAFQHEYDHLEGILFYDRIDQKQPFYSDE